VGAGDIFLAPYADGATTRRTGLAAALQHGLATVATAPEDSSAPWDHGGVELTTDVPSFAGAAARLAADPALRQRCGREARVVFERLLDWQVAVEPYLRLAR
jgi:glycosyltransferase involved in cell wall biosynthesis